ncbi:MAG: VOC family protein [Myxococcota bacterium]
MITHLSHATIWVTDQEVAHDFYVHKLGFEVRMDDDSEGFRWLTVGPPQQKDLELILMPLTPSPMMSEDVVSQMKSLLEKGAMGAGVFRVDDCRAAYASLKERGVVFKGEPEERPYGTEALLVDPFGNWFSMVQPRGATS